MFPLPENGPFMFRYIIFTSGAGPFSEAAMFFTVAKTGQTNPLYDDHKANTAYLSCLEGEGEVRGIQLQHATSPLDVTKFYTLNC